MLTNRGSGPLLGDYYYLVWFMGTERNPQFGRLGLVGGKIEGNEWEFWVSKYLCYKSFGAHKSVLRVVSIYSTGYEGRLFGCQDENA